jgi:hypothetical protein
MPQAEQPGGHENPDIDPVYRPSGDGTIVVYAGDLLLTIDADEHVVPGNLELRLGDRAEFSAHVAGSDPWLVARAFDSQHVTCERSAEQPPASFAPDPQR